MVLGNDYHFLPDITQCSGQISPEIYGMRLTLPETNIAPENGWLEDDRFLMLVSGRV